MQSDLQVSCSWTRTSCLNLGPIPTVFHDIYAHTLKSPIWSPLVPSILVKETSMSRLFVDSVNKVLPMSRLFIGSIDKVLSHLEWKGRNKFEDLFDFNWLKKKSQVAQTFTSWLVTRDGAGSGWRLTACTEIPTLHSIQSGQAYFCSLISLWLLVNVGGSELMKLLKAQLLRLNFSVVTPENGLENVIESLQLFTRWIWSPS